MLSAPLAAFVALAALALQGCGPGGGGDDPVTPTPAPKSPLQADGFVKYPGYAGDLNVAGTVHIGEVDTGVHVIFADLTGVDPACFGPQSGDGNVCGMHIHSGQTCDEGTGGHYFDGDDDPWVPVTFSCPGDGDQDVVKVSGTVLSTGFSLAQLQGRVFVVHDSLGARVACSVLQPVGGTRDLKVPNFVKYPGNEQFDVQGQVDVARFSNFQILDFSLTGADPLCTPDAAITAANGCGIHFHTGTSCEEATGGHYWNDTVIQTDPWVHITYRNAVASGVTIAIETGLVNQDDINGRVVVVHDMGGVRIACGVISDVAQEISASAHSDEEAPGTHPLVWVSGMMVIASLGGGAWYYQSQRQGAYATQQDDSTEMQNAAAQQDDSTEVKNAGAQQDDSAEMHNAA